MALMTPEQMKRKLDELRAAESPEILAAMEQAGANVERTAKRYCTPGHSPYYKAPYSDDRDPRRLLVHMRDQIDHVVVTDKNEAGNPTIKGVVYVKQSGEGEPWHYALYVHTGTFDYAENPEVGEISSSGKIEGMKGMPPRPVIPDSVRAEQIKTIRILERGVREHLKRVCQT